MSTRRTLTGLLIAATLAGGVATGSAVGQDSSAVAVNTRDGSDVFRLAFHIVRATGDTVDTTNAAVAYSSCEACRTVAISIQVLLVQSDPTVFSPTNVAIAYNQDCTLCDTFAAAYQYAVGYGTRIKLSAEALQVIAGIRQELQQLRGEKLSDEELRARLDDIYGRLKDALSTGIIAQAEPAADQAETDADAGAETAPTETVPEQPTSTTPTETAPEDPASTTPTGTTETVPTEAAPTETTPTETTTTP